MNQLVIHVRHSVPNSHELPEHRETWNFRFQIPSEKHRLEDDGESVHKRLRDLQRRSALEMSRQQSDWTVLSNRNINEDRKEKKWWHISIFPKEIHMTQLWSKKPIKHRQPISNTGTAFVCSAEEVWPVKNANGINGCAFYAVHAFADREHSTGLMGVVDQES